MSSRILRTFYLLMFCSGFAGLVYQVLWMKQLGLLFGNTAHATSLTLAVFFAGLAGGSWFWGRRASASGNPLRIYALLEAGVAVTALVYYGLLEIFYSIYPWFYHLEAGTAPTILLKSGLAFLLIFPPSFCMGGTLPAIGEHVIRRGSSFGRTSALLYGINTLGAAAGVGCAAFLLVPWLGFRLSYAVALLLSVGVGVVSWMLSAHPQPAVAMDSEPGLGSKAQRKAKQKRTSSEAAGADAAGAMKSGGWVVAVMAFFSGFSVLALEVVWTRMYAQVHENSVYAFAVILVVVLACLALGAWLSSRLARFDLPPLPTLGVLSTLGGVVMIFGPSMFMKATNGMQPVSEIESWSRFIGRIFYMGFAGIGPVVLVLGMIFPFLMKAAERRAVAPGLLLGKLLALNTGGSIFGSLVCGFILLPSLGMWGTMRLIAVLYILVGILVPYGQRPIGLACRMLGSVFLLLLFTRLNPTKLPTTGVDPKRASEVILETWEGADCTVSVADTESGRRLIRINSGYVLGSTGALFNQIRQGSIPLLLYPDSENIFFLGMGTGMSAGASLDPGFTKVKRVVTCELVPEVVEASEKYMPKEFTGGIFEDPRSTILIEDGRHHLMATDETYDIINADLFLPYRRGAGSLYSLDHFLAAKQRLAPGGSYVQWLPLYQLTEYEFGVIARTMLEAFDHVSMWRNNFDPGREVVALIGQSRVVPIAESPVVPAEEMIQAVEGLRLDDVDPSMVLTEPETMPFFYCGNITAARELFDSYPVNTDDMPLIEYQTPRTFRKAPKGDIIWFVGPRIADLTEQLLKRCPVEDDPILKNRTAANRRFAHAGLAFHHALVAKALGEKEASEEQWRNFQREWRAGAQGAQGPGSEPGEQ